MKSSFYASTLITVLLSVQWLSSSAFTFRSVVRRTPVLAAHREGETTTCDRLTFLKTMASVAVVSPMMAFADDEVGDLSMPTEDEQKAQEVSRRRRRRRLLLMPLMLLIATKNEIQIFEPRILDSCKHVGAFHLL